MTFGQPFYLAGLLLVPLAIFFMIVAEQQRQRAISRIGQPGLIEQLSLRVNRRGRRLRNILWIISLIALLISLSRPQWGEIDHVVEQQGVQVMVALDVSDSMLAEDMRPDRLTRAKLEITDLMTRLEGDELGLVLFSGASFIQFPLTSDYNTARAFLDTASTNIISRPGTVIGDAIRTAMRGFDPNRSSQKVIVVVTDGEDSETDPIAAAQAAADEDVIIYTIGFGLEDGVPIPEFDAYGQQVGFKTDANGEVVLSRIDEDMLSDIAQTTGGTYFRATADGSELDALAAELNRLQQGDIQSRETISRIEHFQLFVAVAIGLMILSELIPNSVVSQKKQRLVQGAEA